MFPQENEYKSLLPKNAHGSPNFDQAACTTVPNGISRSRVGVLRCVSRRSPDDVQISMHCSK